MKRKTQILVLSIIGINTISLVGVLTYSWLVANRTTNDDASGIIAKKPLTVTPYYYSTDSINNTITSYNYNERDNITTNNIFDTNFHDFSGTTDALAISDYTPLETMTYAFKMTGGGTNTISFLLDKVNLLAADVIGAYTDSAKGTAIDISLFDALEFHLYAVDLDTTTINATALNFINEATSISSSITKIKMTSEITNYTLNNDKTQYTLNSSTHYLKSFDLDANGSKMLFMSVIFSNDSATYFTKDSADAYYRDTAGNSNIYKNLALTLSSFIFSF